MSREDIGGGYFRLLPDEGKVLRDKRSKVTYSEVVTNRPANFDEL